MANNSNNTNVVIGLLPSFTKIKNIFFAAEPADDNLNTAERAGPGHGSGCIRVPPNVQEDLFNLEDGGNGYGWEGEQRVGDVRFVLVDRYGPYRGNEHAYGNPFSWHTGQAVNFSPTSGNFSPTGAWNKSASYPDESCGSSPTSGVGKCSESVNKESSGKGSGWTVFPGYRAESCASSPDPGSVIDRRFSGGNTEGSE